MSSKIKARRRSLSTLSLMFDKFVSDLTRFHDWESYSLTDEDKLIISDTVSFLNKKISMLKQ